MLLAALIAFVAERRRCGELEGGLDGEWVWMTGECGAKMVGPVHPDGPAGAFNRKQ